jgi:DNA replication and repair protein RecF
MYLINHECGNFRCLEHIAFAPTPGINVIRGTNAQGKTSVLESVLYLCTSKSHRTNTESELVAHGEEDFHIKTAAQRRDRTVELEAHWWKGSKRLKVNGVAQTRVSDILGRINVVFFCPEDVELIKGGAAQRRRFIDMELSQVDNAYLQALQQFRQLLKQRNELLKARQPDEDLLAVWDEQLALHGNTITRTRAAFLEELSPHAEEAHRAISDGEKLNLLYKPDIKLDEDYADVLARCRRNDLYRQQTTRGPHRDDLEVRVAEKPARTYASQGQQKTAALALKMAELALLCNRTGEYPILMLDEVLAELDPLRARQLFQAIPDAVQCLVTTTQLEARQDPFGRECTNFRIEEGRLAQG